MVKARFYLYRHWWKGQFVVRGQPVQYWNLRLDEGESLHRYWTLDQDPTYVSEKINAIQKRSDDRRLLLFEGIIPPKPKAPEWLKPLNPNKRIPAHVDRLDMGIVTIIEDSPTFISFMFKGKKLKGYWILKKATPKEVTWVFEKSKLPSPKKQERSLHRIPLRKENAIIRLTKEGKLSRRGIAKELGCSSSTVFIYQREHGLI